MDRQLLRRALIGACVVAALIVVVLVLFVRPNRAPRSRVSEDGSAPDVEMTGPVLRTGVARSEHDEELGVMRIQAASGSVAGQSWTFRAARPTQAERVLVDDDGNETTVRSSQAGSGARLDVETDDVSAVNAQRVARALLSDRHVRITGTSPTLTLSSALLVSSGVSVLPRKLRFNNLFPRSACRELDTPVGLDNDALFAACLAGGERIKAVEAASRAP